MAWWLAHARGGGAQGGGAAPTELPLPAMRALSVAGGAGVSAHAGKLVRVWEADTGRRLGAASLRHQPSCCAMGGAEVGGVAAVGDVCGGVQLLWLETFGGRGSEPLPSHAVYGRETPLHSCALLGLRLDHWSADSLRGVLACGSGSGEVHLPPLPVQRRPALTPALEPEPDS